MKIGITGGGIAGLTTAIALKRIGIHAVVYEAAPTIKAVGAGIGLAANAMKGFQKLGIDHAIMQEGRLLDALVIKDERGRQITKTDTLASSQKYGADNFTIHRARLHQVLMSYLDDADVHTNKRLLHFERSGSKVQLHFADGSQEWVDYLIAADGIHSPVRQQLLPTATTRYAGYTCWRAVIDYPADHLREASETWGPMGRFGVVPLKDNKLYWYACVKARENDIRYKNFKVDDLLQTFGSYHPPIPEVLQNTRTEQLIWNDIADLAPLPQYAFDTILLIGDAAHATTPNMGQGACQAIEDAVILADVIQRAPTLPDAFREFERLRMARTQYIVKQSRLIGVVAQLQNKLIGGLRNRLMRALPASAQQKQLDKVLGVEF
ncbi:FAD-dependent monooxygenase [Telluribacter sp. SYSU D00476]|uniref:FAD-dependent monooxygenase n=1 Tax=Telluribacter sp. SYSU D00476 TaxID=2811430 RepID=UPI001FF14E4D|nr:FAD-dependent monooxygenase [Telluribacter sp. SYSU D00476]